MTVALAVRRITSPLLVEAKAACSALNLTIEEWQGGIPRTHPRVVITSIEAGDRHIPDDLVGLLEASPGIRAVVCASEPLVKPRVALAGGRIVLLSPPVDRVRLTAVLRAALGDDLPAPRGGDPGSRFEVLRRQYWIAWSKGSKSPPITLDESDGPTLVLGSKATAATIAPIINEDTNDGRLEDNLAEALGTEGAVVHLTADCSDWLIYWPHRDRPLWITSRNRIPSRWDQATALTKDRRVTRLPAFPGDQIIAGWTDARPEANLFAPLENIVQEGGSETISALIPLSERIPELGAIVIEVR